MMIVRVRIELMSVGVMRARSRGSVVLVKTMSVQRMGFAISCQRWRTVRMPAKSLASLFTQLLRTSLENLCKNLRWQFVDVTGHTLRWLGNRWARNGRYVSCSDS